MSSSTTTTTYTPISIDASVLLNYYAARSGATTAAASTTAKAAGSAPTAPWSKGTTTATLTAAATAVLNGGAFINPSAAKLDVATNNSDYKNLFALSQGLSALEGLAQAAQADGLSAAERLRLQTKFADGLKQVQGFVAGSPFKTVSVTALAAAASVSTVSGVKAENDSYVTQVGRHGRVHRPGPGARGRGPLLGDGHAQRRRHDRGLRPVGHRRRPAQRLGRGAVHERPVQGRRRPDARVGEGPPPARSRRSPPAGRVSAWGPAPRRWPSASTARRWRGVRVRAGRGRGRPRRLRGADERHRLRRRSRPVQARSVGRFGGRVAVHPGASHRRLERARHDPRGRTAPSMCWRT